MQPLVLATNNRHKVSELRALLDERFQIITLAEAGIDHELAEDQDTLEGNSLQKANFVFSIFQNPCVADDTGLEVEALNGEPGVNSAFYAGPQRNAEQNMQLLLQRLQDKTNRRARFRTVMTLASAHGVLQFEGIVNGEIVNTPRGAYGFGYDPVFKPDGFEKTLAEMTADEKNKISHRARAMEKLINFLRQNSF